MTEERKSIIELIEPFMNKELVKWCWIYNKFTKNYTLFENVNWTKKDILARKDIIKILWHYDITAVLEYIEINKSKTAMVELVWKHFYIIEYKKWDNYKKCYWEIPKKPLHLFSEEEEKYLLNKLKELWKQNTRGLDKY
jgi:hypothetical protein